MLPMIVPKIKSGFGAELFLTQNIIIKKYATHEAINSGFFVSKENSIAMNENPVHIMAAINRIIIDCIGCFMMRLTVVLTRPLVSLFIFM
jgi:hypothetical protein